MTIFSKIQASSKLLLTAGLTIALGAFIGWYYNSSVKFKDTTHPPAREEQKDIDLVKEIEKLKHRINKENPTLDDVKDIFTLAARNSSIKTIRLTEKLKKQRRNKFPQQGRHDQYAGYLKLVIEGLQETQNVMVILEREQEEIYHALGINMKKIQNMQEAFSSPELKKSFYPTELTLEQAKESLRIKTEYVEINGQEFIGRVMAASKNLTEIEKQMLPAIIDIVIDDEVLEDRPELDAQDAAFAFIQYHEEMQFDYENYQKALEPINARLQELIMSSDHFRQFLGGAQDPNGGQQMDFNNEIMQRMQHLRLNDPEGMANLMEMLSAQGQGFQHAFLEEA